MQSPTGRDGRRGTDGRAMDVSECATDISTYVMIEALRGVGESERRRRGGVGVGVEKVLYSLLGCDALLSGADDPPGVGRGWLTAGADGPFSEGERKGNRVVRYSTRSSSDPQRLLQILSLPAVILLTPTPPHTVPYILPSRTDILRDKQGVGSACRLLNPLPSVIP